jgi:hypothetical protein
MLLIGFVYLLGAEYERAGRAPPSGMNVVQLRLRGSVRPDPLFEHNVEQ